jgi:hypothetical protein
MEITQEKARLAASQVFSDVKKIEYIGVGDHEEVKFKAHLKSQPDNPAIVSINPNGIRAVVEWKSRKETGYRILKLEGSI